MQGKDTKARIARRVRATPISLPEEVGERGK
jgi:hypothetical protein